MNQFRTVPAWKLEWVGNLGKDGKGAQDHVIARMTPEQFPIHSRTQKHGRIWTAATRDQIVTLLEKNHGLYEVLHPAFKRKIYFDVDKTNLTLEDVKKIVLEVFPNARMQISGREGSWHIILSNYYAINLEQMWPIQMFVNEHADKGFDTVVYTKNRNMKCINQSKVGEPIQAYIEGSKTLAKHLILHDFDDDAIDIASMNLGYELPVIKSGNQSAAQTLDILSIPQQHLPVPLDFDWLNCTPLSKLAILPNSTRGNPTAHSHNVSWQIMTWCRQVGLSFDDCWSWLVRKDGSPERYQRYRKAWNDDKYHISSKRMDLILERFYPLIKISPSTRIFEAQFDLNGISYVDGIDGKYLHCSHIMPPLTSAVPKKSPLEKCGFVIQSKTRGVKHTILADPMGRGKTEAVVHYLKKYRKPKERVLWLTPRITLSNNTVERLRRAGFYVTNYKELSKAQKEEGHMDKKDFVICSIQSLHYLAKSFDFVVTDEPETVFGTFSGNCVTHKIHLSTNWALFISFLQKARKVIYMDAFTSNLTVNFVKAIAGKDYEIVRTKAEADRRTFIETTDFEDWMLRIFECLSKGERLYIFTPFKSGEQGVEWVSKKITSFFNWTEGIEVLSYHADKELEKTKLSDVHSVWGRPNVRCVVTNSTISVGVNFDRKDFFDKIFAHYSSIILVRDFLQALYRVRHPKSTSMYLVRTRFNLFGHEQLSIAHPKCDIYRQMQSDLNIERLANRNTSDWQTFNMLCDYANIGIIPYNKKIAIDQNEEVLEHLEEKLELCFNYQRIADIRDDETFEKKLHKSYSNRATLDDRLEIEKYMFKRKFPKDAIEDELETVWCKKKDFIDKVWTLFLDKGHIIHDILKENRVNLKDCVLPDGMVTKIPLEKLKVHFHFDSAVRDLKSGLIGNVLNAYFGMKVYGIKVIVIKEEDGEPPAKKIKVQVSEGPRGKRKRRYVYTSTEDYEELMGICYRYCEEVSTEERWRLTPD